MTAARRILVVEDDPNVAEMILLYLRQAGYATEHLDDGNKAVASVRLSPPALVLMDLNLHGLDGLDACRQIRAFSQVPIIMLTGRVEEVDRLAGLEGGADDYVCKPFSPREVVLRVGAVLRRATDPTAPSADGPMLRIDDEAGRVVLAGRRINLTPTEFRLFRLLASRPGRIFDRAQLLDLAYADNEDVSDRAIDNHIKNIRRKLAEAAPNAELIHSVYGVGYRFEVKS